MRRTSGAAVWASAMALALLIVPSVAGVAGAAAPARIVGTLPPSSGVFGVEKWVNTSVSFANGTYQTHAFFGYHVIVNVTNVSATVTEVSAVRTLGASFSAQYCRPSCTSPNVSANLSLRAWERQHAEANLTTAATVYENFGGPHNTNLTAVSALGLLNGTTTTRANLTESYSIVRAGQSVAHGALEVQRLSGLSVAFSPALGLVPWNASANQTWNASAAFRAAGGWNDSYRFVDTVRGATNAQHGGSQGSAVHNGTENVRGADLGNLTLRNGRSVTVIVLGFRGPFGFGDGFFLTMGASDLFGGGPEAWSDHSIGLFEAATDRLDFVVDRATHGAALLASASTANVGSSSVGASTIASGSGSPPAASADESLQAQPESLATADQASQCLVSDCASTAGGSASIVPLGLAVLGAVAVVAVAVALVVRGRRPRAPAGTLPSPSDPAFEAPAEPTH